MKLLVIFYLITSILCAILGLDYGQQFSKAAILAPGIQFEIVLTDEGKRKDLSGVCVRNITGGALERVYGSQMGSLITRFPHACILDLKQLLGKTIDDETVKQYKLTHPGAKLVNSTTNGSIQIDLDGNLFSVEELLAMSFQEFKTRAVKLVESSGAGIPVIDDVLVAIPPFASQSTRQAYLDSLHIANFPNVLGLVDEGTSVALDYVTKKLAKETPPSSKQYHLIYDVGAGYTTATIFSLLSNSSGLIVEMESFGYDKFFGGRLLTESVYNIILEKLTSKFNIEKSELTPKIHARLFDVSEKAKNVLSANMEYQTMIESIYNDQDFKVQITREEFEEVNEEYQVSKPIKQALDAINLTISDITTVVLNGGSTRVPFVQKQIIEFVGEEKLSKSVNTDESSVLGTTFRGLDLKTQGQGIKGIKLVEKNYHEYQLKLNQGEFVPIFSQGDKLGASRVNLGDVGNNSTIEIFEDGELIKTYKGVDSKKVKCKDSEVKQIIGKFKLDENKIIDLVSISGKCVNPEHKDSFFEKLLHKKKTTETEDDEEDDIEIKTGTNSTNTTETKPKPKKSKKVSILVPEPVFVGRSSIPYLSLYKSGKRLDDLNKQDKLRAEFEHVKNELEGQCYNLRSYIEDKESELLTEISNFQIEEYNEYINEIIEWLDFESDDANITEVVSKSDELSLKRTEIVNLVRLVKSDLSRDTLETLYQQGSKLVMSIQNMMMEFGQEINDIRTKYTEKSFDFDKENDRLKNKFLKNSERMMKFDKNLADYREVITEFGNVFEKFETFGRKELFEMYDKLEKGVKQMTSDIEYMKGVNKERMEYLEDRFTKLVERDRQRELRSMLKEASKSYEEEKAKEKASSETLEDSSTVSLEEASTQTLQDSSSSSEESLDSSTSTLENVDHDEL
ncbi:Heat shock protein 70 LHS1 [Spathaspora sp. JA1]|nr:Heat shock protein 70 LHS1 [Spathaspora sp. JA1]